jgi:hypothetical protein
MERKALTPAEIAAYVRKAGYPEHLIPTKVAIAMAESSGNPFAHNPNANTGDNSYGLFQINMLGGMGPERRKQFGISSNDQLFNPELNAKAAKQIFDSQGLNAWSVYKSGKYKDFMVEAEKAAKASGQLTPSSSSPQTPPVLSASTQSVNPNEVAPGIVINIKSGKENEKKEEKKEGQSFLSAFIDNMLVNGPDYYAMAMDTDGSYSV